MALSRGHGSKAHLDSNIVLGLAAGGSPRAVAETCKCSESLVHKRLQNPDFAARVEGVRAELRSRAVGKLSALMIRAVQIITDLAERSQEESIRLKAASTLIQSAFKGAEVEALTRQVTDLRRMIEELERDRALSASGAGPAAQAPGLPAPAN
ncbi:MAG TPA: hypothetical protein VHX12_00600, partial [Acidisoma sp.]|nr:hypothetical protein [Acidisoma sp.]